MIQEEQRFVETMLTQLTARLAELFEGNENIVSVMLIGSAARGELSLKIKDDGAADIFSDVEFLIVVDKPTPALFSREVKGVCSRLERELNIRSPLFGFDFGILTKQKARMTPKTLWAFEVREFGKTLIGEDVQDLFPKVEVESIDLGNLNELILVRLWNMFLHLPKNVIKGEATDYELQIAKIYYARNVNDVPTIFLPHIGLLIGGYRARYDALSHSEQGMKVFEGLEEGMTDALAIKLGAVEKSTLEAQRSTFLESFGLLSNYIFETEVMSDGRTLNRHCDERKIQLKLRDGFPRWLRRKFIEIGMISRFYRLDTRSLHIVLGDKIRVKLLKILVLVHEVICNDQPECERIEKTKQAFELYRDISLRNGFRYDQELPSYQNILALRSQMLDFMCCWFYSRSEMTSEELVRIDNWGEK